MGVIFGVFGSAGGAHEAACLYSAWTARDLAEREIKRLESTGESAGCHDGEFYVQEISLDTPRDIWIE